MRKKRFLSLTFLSLLWCSVVYADTASQEIGAFVVMNAKTGRILAQKAAHQRLYPASTTKIATLAYVLGTPDLDIHQRLVVPVEAVKVVPDAEKSRDNFSRYPSYILEGRGTLAGFKSGEIITVEDALYGAILPSGNDAANVLAYYWGNKSIEACVEQLNRFVESLGCTDTHFENPHGLHHPNHISSAYDLGLITSYALQNPIFAKVVSATSYTRAATNKQSSTTWRQSNRLLVSGPQFCTFATGVKTGHHMRAQNCFVASGSTEERSIIVVLLKCSDRKTMFVQAKRYLERYLQEPKISKVVVDAGRIGLTRAIDGQPFPIPLKAVKSCSIAYYPSEEPVITAVAEWLPVSFPIKRGEKLGLLHVYAEGAKIDSVDLVSEEPRVATWSQKLSRIREVLKQHTFVAVGIAVCVAVGLMTLVFRSMYYRRR